MPDHYVSMMNALERLTQRGYRRIGLCLDQRKDRQLKRKWSSSFQAFFRQHARDTGIPVLIEPAVTRTKFLAWFRRYRPELVVGHAQIMVQWLNDLQIRVPEDVGYFNLNMTERIGPCAGLDLEPRRLGASAVEMVAAMLHRQERGVPAYTQTITLEASWIDGPSLRGSALTAAEARPIKKRRLAQRRSRAAR
jgi:LacI family transcriptional regulator